MRLIYYLTGRVLDKNTIIFQLLPEQDARDPPRLKDGLKKG